MEGYAEIAHVLGERPLSHFSYVHSFFFGTLEGLSGNSWRVIELVLAEMDAPSRKIGLRFHRVANVTYSAFEQIVGLYIRSIEERGRENLRYEVGDYETTRSTFSATRSRSTIR